MVGDHNTKAGIIAAWVLAAGLVLGPATIAFAQDDAAALNQRAASLDPQDYKVVQPVCTRCHTAANFLHARNWPEWQDVFSRMHANGATATDAEWGQIYQYFLKSLTTINVNRADEDELSDVLGVDEKTAIAIVRRRADHKFDSAADLESVPGVNKTAIEAMEPRLLFDPPGQGR